MKRAYSRQLFIVVLVVGILMVTATWNRLQGEETEVFTWEHALPEAEGVSSEDLVRVIKVIQEEDYMLHSVIIIRNGKIILEGYLHPYDKEMLHNVKSVCKSIMSALVGISLRENIIPGLDKTVYEFLPQYVTGTMDPRKKEITLRNLLTMTAGLELDDEGPIMRKIMTSKDWIETALGQPMVEDPGVRFNYSTALTHTMSGILTEASGKDLLELGNIFLFGPLGITNVQWKQGPKGYRFGGSELFLTSRDMARIGLLYLDGGRWMGKQVVPEDWIRESTTNQLGSSEPHCEYGYGWWPRSGNRYMAKGWGGQIIGIDPDRKLIVVTTSGDFGAPEVIWNEVMACTMRNAPLPENPEAVAALETLLEALAHPKEVPPLDIPPIAGDIEDKRYFLEKNIRGLTSMMFEFPEGNTGKIILGADLGTIELSVGMDGLYRISETGPLGNMPAGNKIAARGKWVEGNVLYLDFHEIGSPLHAEIEITFMKARMRMSIVMMPTKQVFTINGRI